MALPVVAVQESIADNLVEALVRFAKERRLVVRQSNYGT